MSNMKEIDVNGLFKALSEKGEAKLSDHEIKEPENTKLMKKYFVNEYLDKAADLYKSTYKIPAGKDFDNCINDILNYFYYNSVDPELAKKDCLNQLKNKKLSSTTGAEITVSMNTFEVKPLTKEKIRI